MHLKGVVVVSVLVCVGLGEVMVPVNSGYNVQVVMGGVGVRRTVHVIKLLVPIKFGQHCLWVLLLDCFYVLDISKVQFVDNVANVQSLYLLVNHQSGKDVLVCVRTDMKVARNFFDGEGPCKSTTVIVLEGIPGHFVLFHLVRFPQQLKIPSIDSLSVRVEPVLLNGGFDSV